MIRTAGIAALCLAAALASAPGAAAREAGNGWRLEERAVAGGEPLRVWRLEGPQPGPTLLVMGGIHGDEPGGYLAADQLVDRLALTRGRILLIPRVNLPSILQGERGVSGDMNRMFGRADAEPAVAALQELMGEADALLNLHDGWGYYREAWIDDLHNPRRYGQSIVADAETWTTPEGEVLELGAMARRVVAAINRHIEDPEHHFRFLNTRTADPDSPFAELAHSATYFALTRYAIPGFGVETSKNLPSDALKVRYQLLVIKAFLGELGLLEDPAPVAPLAEPRLDYLLVRVGDDPMNALRPGDTLEVPAGAAVQILGAEANVERGIVIDAEGRGGLDDTGETFVIDAPLRLSVRRDAALLGEALVRPGAGASASFASPAGPARLGPARPRPAGDLEFRAEVDGRLARLGADQVLEVRAGDRLRLLDPAGAGTDLVLDLVGFAGGGPAGPHDDRGHEIDTASQLLRSYSLLGRGEYYRVEARRGARSLGGFYLRVEPARLVALVLERGSGRRDELGDGETLHVARGEVLTIREVETTVEGNADILVNFKGFEGGPGGEDRNLPIHTDRDLLADWALDPAGRLYEILVLHREQPIGRVLVEIAEEAGR